MGSRSARPYHCYKPTIPSDTSANICRAPGAIKVLSGGLMTTEHQDSFSDTRKTARANSLTPRNNRQHHLHDVSMWTIMKVTSVLTLLSCLLAGVLADCSSSCQRQCSALNSLSSLLPPLGPLNASAPSLGDLCNNTCAGQYCSCLKDEINDCQETRKSCRTGTAPLDLVCQLEYNICTNVKQVACVVPVAISSLSVALQTFSGFITKLPGVQDLLELFNKLMPQFADLFKLLPQGISFFVKLITEGISNFTKLFSKGLPDLNKLLAPLLSLTDPSKLNSLFDGSKLALPGLPNLSGTP